MPRILMTSVLLLSLATNCLASPPPATGSDTTERTSPRMVAAYHRESVSSARAGELISRGDNDYAAGRYAEAKKAYRQALDTLDPKKDSEARGQVLLSIGGALRLEGRAVAAEQPLQEALAVFTQNDGEQSLRAALVMEELAKAKSKQNLLDQAEETALRAYHVFEHLLGVSDPRSLLALRTATEILAQKRDAISIIKLIEPRVAHL